MTWLKYAGKRLLMLIPVIICVTFILYLILSAAPGDLASSLLGDDATAEQIAAKKAEMGLDKPLLVRYINYMGGVLKLDFGTSWKNGEAVLECFARRLPNTLLLSTTQGIRHAFLKTIQIHKLQCIFDLVINILFTFILYL